jgi:hypothetical protein
MAGTLFDAPPSKSSTGSSTRPSLPRANPSTIASPPHSPMRTAAAVRRSARPLPGAHRHPLPTPCRYDLNRTHHQIRRRLPSRRLKQPFPIPLPTHPTGLGKRKWEVHQSPCSAVHQKTRRRSIAFVAFGPELSIGGQPDQLSVDPYALAGTQHASFDYGIDIQLASNLGQGLANALIGHRGRAGDYTNCADPPQVSYQFVGHSVGEIVLRRIVGKVFQRQHCQGTDRG